MLDKFADYSAEYRELIESGKFDPSKGAFVNHYPLVYYCLIRHFKPKKIIEVGLGGSTRLASLARSKNYGQVAYITGVDPYYESTDLQEIIEEIIPRSVQEIPRDWIKSKAIFWNEQYLLHAFLIFNSKFRILLSNHYMGRFHPEALLRIYNRRPVGGGSFWMQKRGKAPPKRNRV